MPYGSAYAPRQGPLLHFFGSALERRQRLFMAGLRRLPHCSESRCGSKIPLDASNVTGDCDSRPRSLKLDVPRRPAEGMDWD